MTKHPAAATLLAVSLALATMSCASEPEPKDGVITAYGDTKLDMAPVGETAAPGPRRQATMTDVVDITAGIACAYPDGVEDVQRRALISQALDAEKIDQASFDAELAKASEDMLFAEALAAKMAAMCPEALEKIMGGDEPAP